MPKLIPHADKKILKTACQVFQSQPYKDVDIKEIARGAGIAIGTIYNYYPSKQILFTAAFEETWRVSFKDIEEKVADQTSTERALRILLRQFYWKALEHHLITEEFLKVTATVEHPRFQRLNHLTNLVARVVRRIFDADSPIAGGEERSRRVALTIVMTLWGLTIYYPEDHDKNLIYLTQFVKYIFSFSGLD